jgi:hypothetical protein
MLADARVESCQVRWLRFLSHGTPSRFCLSGWRFLRRGLGALGLAKQLFQIGRLGVVLL